MDPFAGIAETYDWTETGFGDVRFWVECGRQATGPILEIGAGTGRITLPLAEEGMEVVALDLSEAMLAHARRKAAKRHLVPAPLFLVGDFHSLALDRAFGLILAPARVLEHALTPAQRRAAFSRCALHLRPSGRLAVHVWGPPPDEETTPPGNSRSIEAADDHGRLEFSWEEERNFVAGTRTHHFRVQELEGPMRSWRHDPILLGWYQADELDRLGEEAGLRPVGRYSDFERTPWAPGAIQMIWIFERP
jgi:SAM-dependent methyltransferase